MTKQIRVALVGFGKIARDQHVPSIAANPRLELAATSSRSGEGPAPQFEDWRALIAAANELALDAVVITTPPAPRYEIASACLDAGLNVMIEKPPTVGLGEINDLSSIAAANGVTLYCAWHARHHPAVDAAAGLLAHRRISELRICWHESVHKWHPGQRWIWEPGGFGVFDPGINAFSILTRIFPGPLFVRSADLSFPGNAHTPAKADIRFSSPVAEGTLSCSLDFLRPNDEEWTIDVRTEDGIEVRLEQGGARLLVDGHERPLALGDEYAGVYREFVDLIDRGESDPDASPLQIVSDCLLVGRRLPIADVQ